MKTSTPGSVLISLAFIFSAAAFAAPPTARDSAKVTPDMIQTTSDIPADWKPPLGNFDYVKREVMIPMRDGVKLHTVLLIPKGAHSLPMLLERTPYNTDTFTTEIDTATDTTETLPRHSTHVDIFDRLVLLFLLYFAV